MATSPDAIGLRSIVSPSPTLRSDRSSSVARNFPIERPPYPELSHWQAAIDARPAFAVTIGTKPSALSPAA
jgi:hypothetical protein